MALLPRILLLLPLSRCLLPRLWMSLQKLASCTQSEEFPWSTTSHSVLGSFTRKTSATPSCKWVVVWFIQMSAMCVLFICKCEGISAMVVRSVWYPYSIEHTCHLFRSVLLWILIRLCACLLARMSQFTEWTKTSSQLMVSWLCPLLLLVR